MEKQKKCRYCGITTDCRHDVCGYCRDKLPIVRRLLAVGKLIRQCAEEEKKLRQETFNEKEQEQHG